MRDFTEVLSILEFTLNSKQKRHLVGGILLSISFMFGGLAITTMTLKTEEDDNNDY